MISFRRLGSLHKTTQTQAFKSHHPPGWRRPSLPASNAPLSNAHLQQHSVEANAVHRRPVSARRGATGTKLDSLLKKQRNPLTHLVLVSASFQQATHNFYVAICGSNVQRGTPVNVQLLRICISFQQAPCNFPSLQPEDRNMGPILY